jgi:hypothetical protein
LAPGDAFAETARVLRPGETLALTDIAPRGGIAPTTFMRGEKTLGSGICERRALRRCASR